MAPKKQTQLISNNNTMDNNNEGYLSDNENLDNENLDDENLDDENLNDKSKETKQTKETKVIKIDTKPKKSEPKRKNAKRKRKTKAMSKKHNMTEFLKDKDVQELIQTKMMQKAKKEKKIRKPRKSLKKRQRKEITSVSKGDKYMDLSENLHSLSLENLVLNNERKHIQQHNNGTNNSEEKQEDKPEEESSDDGFPEESRRYGYHYNNDSMKNEVLDKSKHFNIQPKSGYESETEDEEEKNNKQILDMINPFTESMKLITRFRKPKQSNKKLKMKKLLRSLTRKNPLLTKRNMSKMSKKINKLYKLDNSKILPQSKSYSKRTGFQYMSSVNNQGKVKEFGNFMVDNSKNPYILKGQIRDGKVIQKKVTRN
tara:strand:- start:624 stop:1733 length:1110 start_codon:yes stop_codon:yes gene_type:complete